jgi:hypothetical protein
MGTVEFVNIGEVEEPKFLKPDQRVVFYIDLVGDDGRVYVITEYRKSSGNVLSGGGWLRADDSIEWSEHVW